MSTPNSRGSPHASRSRSRTRWRRSSKDGEKDRVTFLDNVKKKLGRLSGGEDDPPDGALGAIPKLPRVDPILSPKPMVNTFIIDGNDHKLVLPPDSAKVFEENGQFFIDSGLEDKEDKGKPVLFEVTIEEGTAYLKHFDNKYFDNKWQPFNDNTDIAQRIKKVYKNVSRQKSTRGKRSRRTSIENFVKNNALH